MSDNKEQFTLDNSLESFIELTGDLREGIRMFVAEVDAQLRRLRWYDLELLLEFDNAKRRAGAFIPRGFRLSLSELYVDHASVESIQNTILHEFAHALDWEERGRSDHGVHWRWWCEYLGMTDIASQVDHDDIPDMPLGKWEAVCPTCEEKGLAYRWRLRDDTRLHSRHIKCQNLVVWRKVGE